MNPDASIFWTILQQLESALRTGVANVQPHLQFWLQIFLAWEIVRIAWIGLRGGIGFEIVEGVIRTGLIVWALQYYPELCQRIMNTMIRLGLSVGLGFVDAATFLDPGAWWEVSNQASKPLYEAYRSASMFSTHTPVLLILWLLYKCAFLAIGMGIFAAQAQALVGTMISLVMLPTLAFRGTQWLGGQAIARAVNHGAKLMAWGIVGGLAYNLSKAVALTGQIDIHTALLATGGAFGITILAFIAQRAAAEALGGMATAGISSGMKWAAAAVGSFLVAGTGGGALAARGVAGVATSLRVGQSAGLAAVEQIRHGFSVRGFQQAYTQAQSRPTAQRLATIAQGARRLAMGEPGRGMQGLQHRSLVQLADMTRLVRYSHEGHGGVRQ